MDEKQWLFTVRAQDKPGALTSVASVFSNRGISVDMILGAGPAAEPGCMPAPSGNIHIVFRATETKMRTLLRVVGRLSKVLSADVLPYDSDRLRQVALLRIEGDPPPAPDGVHIERHGDSVAVIGPTRRVEALIVQLREEKRLLDASWVVLPAGLAGDRPAQD